ncbi:MAG: hypothetical protein PWQ20_1276 [Thermotogaceae bacterium]|nr:hypothetical protein [Thermotogaceae bacterium]MDN5338206.1 hypothetical protein [Thermotogaceae bacterium]
MGFLLFLLVIFLIYKFFSWILGGDDIKIEVKTSKANDSKTASLKKDKDNNVETAVLVEENPRETKLENLPEKISDEETLISVTQEVCQDDSLEKSNEFSQDAEKTIDLEQIEIEDKIENDFFETVELDKALDFETHETHQKTREIEKPKVSSDIYEQLYSIVMEKKGYLLHVTEFKNIPSILKHGILSQNKLEEKKITPSYITDDLSKNLDSKKGTQDYVKLSYSEYYDMYSGVIHYERLRNPSIIKIDPRIILDKKDELLFSNKNSTKSDAKIGNLTEIFPKLNFEKIYKKPRNFQEKSHLKEYNQAEIMVKDVIPTEYFIEIILPENKKGKVAIPEGIKVSYGNTTSMLYKKFPRS